MTPLGRAKGVVINGGIRIQLALAVFLIVFGLTAATAVLISRVRQGWREADALEEAFEAPAAQEPLRSA